MENISFAPQQREQSDQKDVVATTLATIARNILVVVLGITPLFFVPASYAPFNFSKTLFVILGVFFALIFYSLSVLRSGTLELRSSVGVLSAWGLAIVVFASAMFSGDVRDALVGDAFSPQTAIFVALLALIVSIMSMLRGHKRSIMNLYILLIGCGVVIGLYHVLRLVFGADTLTLGVLTSATATPLGGWNDLGLFFGLALLLALVSVEQFPLTKWGKVLFGSVSVLSLIILAVVNFFAIWVVLGLVSFIVLMYSLTKHRFRKAATNDDAGNTVASIVLSVAVFIISMVFIAGGSSIGQSISELTGVSYLEVRPSFLATFNVTRDVYGENMFFGTGPNKFIDAWRQYKDPAINQTIFWNSPFETGVGYIPTFAVTTGIFGLMAWAIFLFFVLYAGVKTLFIRPPRDSFWYFVGASAFVSALYLWGMSIFYVPGPAILVLAALFTGILFVAQSTGEEGKTLTLSMSEGRGHGFVMVALATVIIVASVSVLFYSSRHYTGLLSFNKAIASMQDGASLETIESQISDSYEISNNDRFAREIVGIQLQKMNSMLSLQNPTDAQTQQFQSIVVNAINAGQLAVDIDPTEPRNWQSLAGVYSILAGAGIEGAEERARESLQNALQYDPNNPEIYLQLAQLENRIGNLEAAGELTQRAISLKSNYSEAYLFASQIDIARGDVEGAIRATLANITLEPRNPQRYYQLGVLYSSQGQTEEAALAFEEAIVFDPDYANARYFLAFAYDELGRTQEAEAQLARVLELNPGNADVIELLGRIGRGESLTRTATPEPVPEVEPEVGESGELISPEDPDSPLLSPVNTVPEGEESTGLFESEEFTEAVEEAVATDTEETATDTQDE